MSSYFVIDNSNGDTLVREYDYDQLMAWLVDNDHEQDEFLDELPGSDANYWRGQIAIIKGDLVTPQPVTSWQVP